LAQIRYLKSKDPDYAKALKAAGIPVYVPTPEELDLTRDPFATAPTSMKIFHQNEPRSTNPPNP